MPTKGYIYLIRNLLNGKAYIGKTERTIHLRFSQHKIEANAGSKCALHAAMRKYGTHNFSIIEIASSEPHQLNDLEKHFIAVYETFAPLGRGYNLTLGGEGQSGRKFGPHSEQHRKKISEGNKGRVFTDETRAKIAFSNRGQTRSEETKRKLSTSHKGKTIPPETRSKMTAAQKSRWANMSKVARDSIASKLRGKKAPVRSEEWHRKQSKAQSKPWSLARREAQSRKPVAR